MNATIEIQFEGNALAVLKQLEQRLGALEKTALKTEKATVSGFQKMNGALKAISFVNITTGLQNMQQGFESINGPGLKFETSMKDLKAITGLTGKSLDDVGLAARANAKHFGGSAADSVESYKLILSQLGPELAKQPALLSNMGRYATLLSKTMGGDVTGATEVLTTAMNQYGVDMYKPIEATRMMGEMMNIMSAASKAGSSELPQIKAAVENSGAEAQAAGLKFSTLNSAIQSLDKAGKKGAEGGTALRSILTTLGKGRFLPKETREELVKAGVDVNKLADKTVSFTDKMRMLQPVMNKDRALINTLFGEYGAAAGQLISTADAQDEMTKAIEGTNTTQEQAKAVMESTEEKISRMNAAIADGKIRFFEATGGATAYLTPLTEIATTMSSFVPLFSGASKAIQWLGKTKLVSAIATKAVTAATWLWNAALTANPIGLLIVGIAAAGAAVYGLSKAFGASSAASRVDNEVKSRVIDKTVEQESALNQLFDSLKSAKVGSEEYNGTLKELEAMQPGIVDKYNLQAGAIKDINAAQKEMIANIIAIAEAEALKELIKEDKMKELRLKKEGPSTWNKIVGFGGVYDAEALNRGEQRDARDQANYSAAKLAKLESSQKYKNAKKNQQGGAVDAITPPTTPTTPPTEDPKKPPAIVSAGGRSGSNSAAFSSDSKEAKRIDVRFTNLVQNLTVQVQNMKDGSSQIKEQITEALIGAVRDFEVAL